LQTALQLLLKFPQAQSITTKQLHQLLRSLIRLGTGPCVRLLLRGGCTNS
jgi:hypothetical protein